MLSAITNHYDQFTTYQQWAHNMFSLISENQWDSLMSQTYLTTLVNNIQSSLSNYVQEWIQAYE